MFRNIKRDYKLAFSRILGEGGAQRRMRGGAVCTAYRARLIYAFWIIFVISNRKERKMKKYYINIRNSKKKMIVDLFPIPIFSIYIVFFLWLVLTYPWIVAIPFGFVICMLAYFVIPYSVYALTNRIYVDEEKGEILLKRFRRKDQVIKFSSISRLETAKNDDASLGGINGRGGATVYAVKNTDGYVMFYFVNDKVLLELFESHQIPIINIPFDYI